MKIELFTTSTCVKCPKLKEWLKKTHIKFVERVFDTDPEAETDALMNYIYSAPTMKIGDNILRTKDIIDENKNVNEEKIMEFINKWMM